MVGGWDKQKNQIFTVIFIVKSLCSICYDHRGSINLIYFQQNNPINNNFDVEILKRWIQLDFRCHFSLKKMNLFSTLKN